MTPNQMWKISLWFYAIFVISFFGIYLSYEYFDIRITEIIIIAINNEVSTSLSYIIASWIHSFILYGMIVSVILLRVSMHYKSMLVGERDNKYNQM